MLNINPNGNDDAREAGDYGDNEVGPWKCSSCGEYAERVLEDGPEKICGKCLAEELWERVAKLQEASC